MMLPLLAPAQTVSFGVKGGVPGQTPLGSTDDRIPFVVGPTIDFRIDPRLSIESGVLFDRLGQQNGTLAFTNQDNSLTLVDTRQTARAVEVPILAKVHLLSGKRTWRPFVAAGPTIRHTSVDSNYASSVFGGTSLAQLNQPLFLNSTQSKWNVDPAAGIGVDVRAGRFHLEPEVRYSYWGAGKTMNLRKNQVAFLLGFRL